MIEQFVCVLRVQLLFYGIILNSATIISLSVDCLVAVYQPLSFRSIMTKKQIYWTNGSIMIIFAFICLTPIPLVGFQNDGYLRGMCDVRKVLPFNYLTLCILIGLVGWATIFILNISVTIGVFKALIERQKITSGTHNNKIKGKLLKLVIRLLAIVIVNIVSNIPVNILLIGPILFNPIAMYGLSILSGVGYVLIFVISDGKVRTSLKHTFCYKKCP